LSLLPLCELDGKRTGEVATPVHLGKEGGKASILRNNSSLEELKL